MPDTITDSLFKALYYMVDFRRIDRRRVLLPQKEHLRTTLCGFNMEDGDQAKVKAAFEKIDPSKVSLLPLVSMCFSTSKMMCNNPPLS